MQGGGNFFQNTACEYFPCHTGVPEEEFNCLFCYCPLYCLGRDCGGDFEILSSGIKSCMGCRVPHRAEGYGHMTDKLREVLRRTSEICGDS